MKTASQVPSGVAIMTSVATTGSAACAEPVATARPPATERATKSRRERSAARSGRSFESCEASGIVVLRLRLLDEQRGYAFGAKYWASGRARPQRLDA